jgi:TolA-binding protein
MSPKYLMQAARLAMSLQRGKTAVLYFDKILKHYKSSPQASMALFLKAFSYEQIVGDTAKAKKYYTEFIHDYPNDKLVEDAKASIQYLGVPDSILLKHLEEKTK